MTISQSPRRWSPGVPFYVDPMWYRVVEGYKGPADLRLEWRIARAWQPIPMAHAALHTDFFYENEDVLYPPTDGYQGGNYFMTFLRNSATDGWHSAVAKLEDEKKNKRRNVS